MAQPALSVLAKGEKCWKCRRAEICDSPDGIAFVCGHCGVPWPGIVQSLNLLKVVEHETIRLSGGETSSWYVNLKDRLANGPDWLVHIARLMDLEIAPRGNASRWIPRPRRIAGPPTGGHLLATALAIRTRLPCLLIRDESSAYRHARRCVGKALTPGERVLLVDDVATTGGTLLRGVQDLRHDGFDVRDALVLVERGRAARRLLRSLTPPVRLKAMCDASDLWGVPNGPDPAHARA